MGHLPLKSNQRFRGCTGRSEDHRAVPQHRMHTPRDAGRACTCAHTQCPHPAFRQLLGSCARRAGWPCGAGTRTERGSTSWGTPTACTMPGLWNPPPSTVRLARGGSGSSTPALRRLPVACRFIVCSVLHHPLLADGGVKCGRCWATASMVQRGRVLTELTTCGAFLQVTGRVPWVPGPSHHAAM